MRCISLLSSGIDSPVATFILSSYVDEMVFMHIDAKPFTDDLELKNFTRIAFHLKSIIQPIVKVCIVSHGKALDVYKNGSFHPRFSCVFCKRMMLRYAEAYAKKNHVDFIVMGDSLGQVASQTLANIMVVDDAVSIPIIRPLIGFDKEEIIEIARKIDTYDLSIQESIGCLAVPNKPATQATGKQLSDIEQHLDINGLVNHAIKNIKYIE